MSNTTPSGADALLPCPFCGGEPFGHAIEAHEHSPWLKSLAPNLPDHPGSYVIECGCGAGYIDETQDGCATRWNRRAALSAAQDAPDGRLHVDGYFTWNGGKRPAYIADSGLPCDFYLAAVAPAAPRPAAQQRDAMRAAARALSDRVAEMCNMDKEDHWKYHYDDVLSDTELVVSTFLAAQAQEAAPAARGEPSDPIRRLIEAHAHILETNEYAYFELAYTRQTGWMAWLTDKPLCAPVTDPDRLVLAQGQGATPDEACDMAARAAQQKGGGA